MQKSFPSYVVLIGPNGAVQIDKYICKWGYNLRSSDWTWQVSVHWSKEKNQGFPAVVYSDCVNRQVQEAEKFSMWLFWKCRVQERPQSSMAARLWLWIRAQLTRSPLWQIYFSLEFTNETGYLDEEISKQSIVPKQSSYSWPL